MTIADQIDAYIASQPAAKRADMTALHRMMLALVPDGRLWFLDGKDSAGKTVSNPNIGYGFHTMTYADGTHRDFYQIGLSANTAGISIYILGLDDKTYLSRSYGPAIGKAAVTGYCIRFKALKDIDIEVLKAAIRDGLATKDQAIG